MRPSKRRIQSWHHPILQEAPCAPLSIATASKEGLPLFQYTANNSSSNPRRSCNGMALIFPCQRAFYATRFIFPVNSNDLFCISESHPGSQTDEQDSQTILTIRQRNPIQKHFSTGLESVFQRVGHPKTIYCIVQVSTFGKKKRGRFGGLPPQSNQPQRMLTST